MTLKLATLLGAISTLALSGCATPAVTEAHADPATRMLAVAQRFDQDRRTAGMAGVIDDIGKCYARASSLVIEIYALRDCLVLDYVAYRTDVTIGRRIDGAPLPFFTDQAFAARAGRYAQLDGFTTTQQLMKYLTDTNELVQLDLRTQINAAPVGPR
jgi:hypothetical protein